MDLAAAEEDLECEVIVDSCLVEEWGRSETGDEPSFREAIGVRIRAPRVVVRHNQICNALDDGDEEEIAVTLEQPALQLLWIELRNDGWRLGKALVLGNQFRGTARSTLVDVGFKPADVETDHPQSFARVIFSDNDVEHRSPREGGNDFFATCRLGGGRLVVGDNNVKSQSGFASFLLYSKEVPGIFIGNVMTGAPTLHNNVVPSNIQDFNVMS